MRVLLLIGTDYLATTHGNHNFKAGPGVQWRGGVLAFGHNFTVQFDSDALAGEFEAFHKVRHSAVLGHFTIFTVDCNLNHGLSE